MARKKTHEEFVKEVEEKYGDEYTILGLYIGCQSKIETKHNICGTIWYPNADDLLSKKICPKCGKEKNCLNITKSPEQFKIDFYEVSNGEYELLSEYTRSANKIKILHKKCSNTFEMTPNKFLSGQRCPNCRVNKKKTLEDFKQDMFSLYKDEFTVIGDFTNTYTKVKLKHNKCDNIISVKPSDFLLQKTYCKFCNQSALESSVDSCLKYLDIKYKTQVTFDDLKGVKGKLLSYDFYFVYNNKTYVVECQGEQHYKPIEYFGGIDKFKIQQIHDFYKENYAKKYDMYLIKISYLDFKNVEEILKNTLLIK